MLSTLKTAIQDYCQNSEATFVSHLDDFIISVEDKVFAAVQMPAFWKSDVSLVTAGDDADYGVAAGSLDILSVRLNETEASVPGEVSKGPVRYLLRKDYDFLLEAYPGTTDDPSTGIPKYYAISTAGIRSAANPGVTIRLGPIPDAVYALTVDYYGKTTDDSLVTVGEGYTWLSATFPQVLLNGCLAEAYSFMKGEPDLIQNYQAQFQEGVGMVKAFGEGRQSADSYTDGAKSVPVQ